MRTKELSRIALGSVTGTLLGAVVFLGIEGAVPRATAEKVFKQAFACSLPQDSDLMVDALIRISC